MSETQKTEVRKLLWHYLKTPSKEIPHRIQNLTDYLEREQIPLSTLRITFKDCEETHLNAISAYSTIATRSIEQARGFAA